MRGGSERSCHKQNLQSERSLMKTQFPIRSLRQNLVTLSGSCPLLYSHTNAQLDYSNKMARVVFWAFKANSQQQQNPRLGILSSAQKINFNRMTLAVYSSHTPRR